MGSEDSNLYRLFRKLCDTYSPEEVKAWQEEHWPGLERVLRAMAGESIQWQERAPAPPDSAQWGTGPVQADEWATRTARPERQAECAHHTPPLALAA